MSAQPPSEDPTQQFNPQSGGQPPQGGGSNPWPWVLGAIAIVVVGVIAAILITGGNDSSSSTDASVATPVTTLTTKTATSTPTTTVTPTTTTTTTTAPINIMRTCNVSNIPGVVDSSTVAIVNATNVPSSQTALASCTQASALVKEVARTGAEMPVTVQGFACTPSVSGSTAKWTCVLDGADSALTVTTKFPLTYTN